MKPRNPAPAVARARARRANAVGRGDIAAAESALLELRAAKAAEYIRQLVESAPPLTQAHRDSLSALLAPVQGGAAAA